MLGLTAIVALVVLALLAPAARAAGTPPPEYSEALVASGFASPTALAFLPNGDLLVTEKAGALKRVSGGTVSTLTTLTTCSTSEMGLLGIAVDPAFTTSGNGFVYLYKTTPGAGGCGTSTGRFNQVIRLTFSGGAVSGSPTVLLTGIQTDGGNHDGGTLRIGPIDSKLYVSVGDTGIGDGGPPGASTNPYSQDLSHLEGKILRLELSGAPAAGNPFIATPGARPEIWARGFRNPFRIGFDSQSGNLFAGDVGQETIEEIDVVQAGGNYAWPRCEGSLPVGCQQPGDINPIFEYLHSGSGVVGRSVTGGTVAGKSFGFYNDQYYFGDFTASKIWRAQLNATRDGFNATPVDFVTGAAGPVDIIFGPNGDLYYAAINAGEVRRVTPNYARPQGATPVYAALVPAHQVCASPNRVHAAPLSYSSCNPPNQTSSSLTVGTPDANGAAANATGSVRLTTLAGGDVRIVAALRDVRCQAGVATCSGVNTASGNDYTGQVQVRIPHRITDKNNNAPSGGSTAATTVETAFNVTVPCATTVDTSIGGACDVNTTANTLVPGAVTAGMRAIWELNQLQVFDGGSDGVVSTNPNTLFAVQGIFIP